MSSPFKIRIAEPNITEEDAQAVYTAVKEKFLSGSGPYNKEFEKDFAEYVVWGVNGVPMALISLLK